MKHLLAMGGAVLVASIVHLSAQTTATNALAATIAPPVHKHLVFQPTSDDSGGIAPIQVGGGSRGGEKSDFSLYVLVPNQTALTTQAQPSLYWYQSAEATAECEVTVTEPKNPKPLLELKTGKLTPAGIHAIRLSKFNVNLKPGVVYKWSVAVVVDPENRSQDIYANGVIKRIDPSPEMAAKLAAATDGSDKAAIYAENSIWYDALQAISDQIDRDPHNADLRDERASLLKQVGLDGQEMEKTVVQGH